MRHLLRIFCFFVGLCVAGCEDKVPTQAGPKAVQVKTTGGTTTP